VVGDIPAYTLPEGVAATESHGTYTFQIT